MIPTTLGTLARQLSELSTLQNPNIKLEQYQTDSQTAAKVLWSAFLLGDIKGKIVADLGCGTGIFGIGSLLLGAKKAYFVESDPSALEQTKENLKKVNLTKKATLGNQDITSFENTVDTVIQNPPFGTKKEHADKLFLIQAFTHANIVYSMHKTTTKVFIEAIAKDYKMNITHEWKMEFPIKSTFKFHKKRIERIDVSVWRFEKEQKKSEKEE